MCDTLPNYTTQDMYLPRSCDHTHSHTHTHAHTLTHTHTRTHTHTHMSHSHNSHCNVLRYQFQEACLGSTTADSATLYNNSCTDTLSTINRRGEELTHKIFTSSTLSNTQLVHIDMFWQSGETPSLGTFLITSRTDSNRSRDCVK